MMRCPLMNKTDENVDQVKEIVKENRRITICVVADSDPERCPDHVSDCHQICVLPADNQKQNCVNIYHNHQRGLKENSEFHLMIITGDVTWLMGYPII
jgi:hypothetical protein